jgi:hypothetical protein
MEVFEGAQRPERAERQFVYVSRQTIPPDVRAGDAVIVDAGRIPERGDLAIAVTADGLRIARCEGVSRCVRAGAGGGMLVAMGEGPMLVRGVVVSVVKRWG